MLPLRQEACSRRVTLLPELMQFVGIPFLKGKVPGFMNIFPVIIEFLQIRLCFVADKFPGFVTDTLGFGKQLIIFQAVFTKDFRSSV